MKKLPVHVCALLLTFLVGDVVHALPRFSSRTAAKCQSCHVNPSGGGMRQAFGQQYGRETLPVPTWSDEFAFDEFSTKLTEAVSVGADFRTLFFIQETPDSSGTSSVSNNAFFQMQGDVYLQFRLARKVSIYIDKGIYSGFEIFGMLNILPGNGFIKVGKFVPHFGTKLDDHRTFIRDQTGFSPERGRAELTGGEIGFSPGQFSITGGVYNATDGFGSGVTSNKALLGRIEGLFKLSEEMHLGLGGNIFTKQLGSGNRMTIFGGMGSFSYADLTVMAEVDWLRNRIGGVKTTGLVSYIEAGYVVTPGVDLKFVYEFADPDIDIKSGAVSRYSFGFEFFPISGVELRPLYRISKEDPVDLKNNEFNLLMHFYL